MAATVAPWIELEPPKNPAPSSHPPRDQAPSASELDQLRFGALYTGPARGLPVPGIPTPGLTEARRTAGSIVEAAQSVSDPPRNRWRFGAACVMFMQFGLNDSAPGALLPYLQKHYSIDYSTVSFVFVANAAGFIGAAFITNQLNARLGRAKVLALGMLCSVVAYAMIVSTPSFALVIVSFFLVGLGNGLGLALTNSWIANLVNGTTLLGLCHGSYGMGGVLGPLIATAIVSAGHAWSVFYILMLAMAIINCAGVWVSFQGFEQEHEQSEPLIPATEREAPRGGTNLRSKPKASLWQVLRSRVVLLGAMFIFFYQASEVTISGWVLSFLLSSRAHSPGQSASLGYITSGFFAGITLGRVVLSPTTQRIGEKISVVGLLAVTTVLQFVVWFVPNIFADAVAVAIVGLLLGPVYPAATIVFSKLLTRDQLVPALSIVTAVGSSGGAAGPFVTGVIGQKSGPWVLNPIVVTLIGGMFACWFGLPRIAKRAE